MLHSKSQFVRENLVICLGDEYILKNCIDFMKNSNSLKRESKLGIQSAQKLTKLLKKCHKVYKTAKGLEKSQDFEKLPWKP